MFRVLRDTYFGIGSIDAHIAAFADLAREVHQVGKGLKTSQALNLILSFIV